MTQTHLAALLRTSPATVSRLERENMTVSLDWLRRLSQALGVTVVDLLAFGTGQSGTETPAAGRGMSMTLLGGIDGGGWLTPASPDGGVRFTLEVPCVDPVAVRLTRAIGIWRKGEILIAARHSSPDRFSSCLGRDCLVGLLDARVGLGRLIQMPGGSLALMPPEAGQAICDGLQPAWIAPIVMRVEILHGTTQA